MGIWAVRFLFHRFHKRLSPIPSLVLIVYCTISRWYVKNHLIIGEGFGGEAVAGM